MRTFVHLALVALPVLGGCQKEAAPPPSAATVTAPVKAARVIELKVTANGFEPSKLSLKKGEPVKFVVTRLSDETCATELLIADTDIKADLPLNKPVEITWTPAKGGEVKFGCAMNMMVGGVLLVE